MKRKVIAFCLLVLFTGCTSLGIGGREALDQTELNLQEPEELRICVYRDPDIDMGRVEELVEAIREEMAPHGIRVTVPWEREWLRPAFMYDGIIRNIASCPLEAPCDRLLGIVSRHFGDFLWGIVLPDVGGMVETVTNTKAYAVGEWGSINQVLSLMSPARHAVHETYHLLGCDHSLFLGGCYRQVALLKKLARANRENGNDFFSAQNLEGKLFRTRAEVEEALKEALKNDLN